MHTTRRTMLGAAAALPALGTRAQGTAQGAAQGAAAPEGIAAMLAPSGTLRAAINLGNPVLAQPGPEGEEPRGVSVVLAREVARRLGVPLAMQTFPAAGRVTEAGREGAWDICFLARDPVRARGILFTAPYVVIEGTYLVRAASPLRRTEDFERPGLRVAVGRNSAYDLHLSRATPRAEFVRVTTSAGAVEAFREGGLDAAAGVRQPLVAYAAANPEFRVIPGRFMVIEQAVGIPGGREAALPWLAAFVEEAKASGLVARTLAASGQADAEVAPPAG